MSAPGRGCVKTLHFAQTEHDSQTAAAPWASSQYALRATDETASIERVWKAHAPTSFIAFIVLVMPRIAMTLFML